MERALARGPGARAPGRLAVERHHLAGEAGGTGRVLTDGRVQMLVYLPPNLVKAVKQAALDQDVSASHVVEQAVVRWLAEAAERSRRDQAT